MCSCWVGSPELLNQYNLPLLDVSLILAMFQEHICSFRLDWNRKRALSALLVRRMLWSRVIPLQFSRYMSLNQNSPHIISIVVREAVVDYFLKQHFLLGMDWIIEYYLEELQKFTAGDVYSCHCFLKCYNKLRQAKFGWSEDIYI
jgi:hypothetical protein